MNRSHWASLGSVALAAASSACCWLPAVTIVLGLGAGSAGFLLERYRWGFVAGAAMLLGLGFYLEYGLGERCAPDGSCPPDRPVLRRLNRGLLWFSAGIVAIFALFPELRAALPSTRAGEPSVVRLSSSGRELRDRFNGDVRSTRMIAFLSPT